MSSSSAAHVTPVDQSINWATLGLANASTLIGHDGKVEMSWKDIDVLVKYKILDEQRAEILWHYLHSGEGAKFFQRIFDVASPFIRLSDGSLIHNPFFDRDTKEGDYEKATTTAPPPPPTRGPSWASRFWSKAGVLFSASNVLYLLGGLIVAGAMTFFMTVAWEAFRGAGVAFMSAAYGSGLYYAGHFLLHKGKEVPAAMFFLMATASAPLFAYGILHAFGLFKSKDGKNEFFAFTHAAAVGKKFIPIEAFSLAVTYFILWRHPGPFLTIPLYLHLSLVVRDLPDLIPANHAFKAWVRFALSGGLIYMSQKQLTLPQDMPTSHSWGFTFLPNSPSWGLYISLVVFLAAFINLQTQHRRAYKNILFPALLCSSLLGLAFINYPEWHFLLVPLYVSASAFLSVLPFFIFNKPSAYSAALFGSLGLFIAFASMVLSYVLPKVPVLVQLVSSIPAAYVEAAVAHEVERWFTGSFILAWAFSVLSTYDTPILPTLFVLLALQSICSPFVVAFHSGIAMGLWLTIAVNVVYAIYMTIAKIKWKATTLTLRLQYSFASAALLLLTIAIDHRMILLPFDVPRASTTFILYITSNLTILWSAFMIEEQYRYYERHFYPFMEPAYAITSIIALYAFQSAFFVVPLVLALWAIAVDVPQFKYVVSRRWDTPTAEKASAWGSLIYGVLLNRVGVILLNDPIGFRHSAAMICLFVAYLAISASIIYFLWDSRRLLFLVAYYLLALHTTVYPHFWLHILASISIVFGMFILESDHFTDRKYRGLLNFYTGFLIELFAIVAFNFGASKWVSLLLELVAGIGIFLGFSSLVNDHEWSLRIKVVITFSSSVVLLLASSFQSFTHGVGALLWSLLTLAFTAAIVTELQRKNMANIFNNLVAVVLCCGLILLSPICENLFMYWVPLLIISAALGALLVKLKLWPIVVMLIACAPLIYTGVVLQAKLLVLLGYVVIFLGINALAISVFPSSLVFPFVLTFCGIAFIYAGMTFEVSANMMTAQTTGQYAGNVQRWTQEFIEAVVAPLWAVLSREDPFTAVARSSLKRHFG